MKTNRLFFIDTVRAFAILMMLQGHFIDTLIKPVYKDTSYTAFNVWSYFRGITAPVFFTISGLVFLYLLLKANAKGDDQKRIRKGLTRGLMLIGIGYLLRLSLKDWLSGYFNPSLLAVDVLQCIGLSLILIVCLYLISRKSSTILAVLLFVLGFICFVSEPLYRTITLENIPLFFANWMTLANGSVFTILPWFGYMAYGGFIATLFFKYGQKYRFKPMVISGFVVVGLFLIYFSSYALHQLSYLFDIKLFEQSADYNYLFTRLGNVLLLFALFYTFESYLKQSIITKIGEKTLSIYVVHFIIIYGSFTGFGLKRFLDKSLDPWQAIIGAIIFMISVCVIVFYEGKTNAFIYKHLRRFLHLVKTPKTDNIS
ncbi:MAG: heparan-alpha-glucosaminide N-acetyltransferase domain-containing protein [Gelidibacter sp.]